MSTFLCSPIYTHRRPELPYLSSPGSNGFHEKDPAVSCGKSPSGPQSCSESRHPMRSMDSPRTRATIERRNRGSVPSGCADIKRRELEHARWVDHIIHEPMPISLFTAHSRESEEIGARAPVAGCPTILSFLPLVASVNAPQEIAKGKVSRNGRTSSLQALPPVPIHIDSDSELGEHVRWASAFFCYSSTSIHRFEDSRLHHRGAPAFGVSAVRGQRSGRSNGCS